MVFCSFVDIHYRFNVSYHHMVQGDAALMRFRKKIFLRILSTIICTTVAFTIMPGFDSYAKATQE